MVSVGSHLDDEPSNRYELIGRYIAQTINIEVVLDRIIFVYLSESVSWPREQFWTRSVLGNMGLSRKVAVVADLIDAEGFADFADLPTRLRKVVTYRNRLAHRMLLPDHEAGRGHVDQYGRKTEVLTAEEQERQRVETIAVHTACCELHSVLLRRLPQEG
jgi:hypothetical protein